MLREGLCVLVVLAVLVIVAHATLRDCVGLGLALRCGCGCVGFSKQLQFVFRGVMLCGGLSFSFSLRGQDRHRLSRATAVAAMMLGMVRVRVRLRLAPRVSLRLVVSG